MESEKQTTERETPPQHWTSYKLIIDPALTKGLYKVCRYDGQCFNIPVEDLGLFPVETVRDPRVCRLWSKSIKTDLLVPKFKVDEWYVGPVPPKEVTFSRLNDNVRETFLTNMCKKYGNIEEVEIFCNPKNKKHLGIAKVLFDTVRAAKHAVQNLHQTSVMGNVIHVEIDPKGENRARYIQLLLSGLYTPRTLPVGSSERALQSLIDSLLDSAAPQPQGSISSPTSIATPLSLDTAYSSIWQDTPCSFRLTPLSQGTPRTPCFSATPLSQDSCYSSLQATPILQGEPSTYSVHKPLRQELCLRKPLRYRRGSGRASKVNFVLKHCQSQPAHLFSNQRQTSGQQLVLWGHNAHSSIQNNKDASFNLASPFQESGDVVNTSSTALPLNCNSFSIPSINFTADQQTIASSPPDDQQPEVESLDSRIESLLINNQISDPSYLDRETLEADGDSLDSPASPCSPLNAPFLDDSLVCTPAACGSFSSSHQHAYHNVLHPSPAILVENEEDETTQAVSFLTRNSQSPISSDYTYFERRSHIDNDSDSERFQSLFCQKEHRAAHEDKEHSNNRESGALAPTDFSLPEHPSISSLSSTIQYHTLKTPPAVTTGCSHPPVAPFPFPIPPFPASIPPVPPRLPNGVIPIPPPGWIPPLGHHTGIPIPPPPIPPPPPPSMPPPPTFLRCPPPVMMPPPVPPPVHLHGSAPLSFPRPAWSAPPFPTFNPFVPPPDYQPVQEKPHKITAEKVLEVLIDELKSIIKKDLTRRMIEGFAFQAFEDWWNCQEKKAKIQVSPLKRGATSVKDRKKLISSLSHISGQGKKPPLPSFKIKRKRSEEIENEPCCTHESSDVKHREDIGRPASERAKRRHARPLELDSDDDDDDDDDDDMVKEEDSTLQDEGMSSEKVEAVVPVGLQIMSDRDDHDDGDDSNNPEEENKLGEEQREEEATVVFQTTDGVQRADSDFSESSSSEESSSDFDCSESFYSESFEDSSSDFSTEDKDMDDDEDDDRSDECIVISSDEDSAELEPPPTPSAPFTPGAQLDLDLQDWSDLFHREKTVENQYTSYQQDACNLDAMMELHTTEYQELLPPSPIGLAAEEPGLDLAMESSEWIVEPADNIENLRPLTPTGCLVDSDPDILIKSKPKSPAVEEVERPRTPGKGIVTELENEHSNEAEEVFSLSPANSEFILASSDLLSASYPLYQEMPKTPGREERSVWTQCSSARVPATPGREMTEGSTVCPSLNSPPPVLHSSSNPYITAPKTPGRDIILPRRAIVHKRKTQRVTTSMPLLSNGFVTVSSPCSLSESGSDTSDGSDGQTSSGVRVKPLQGLENMPGLLDEEKSLMRQKLWWRLKRRRRARHRRRSRKRITGSLSSASHPLCEERRILHNVWKEGLDEEDARLLQRTYERLQEQNNGFGWLSDTLWIPHPLTKVPTEKPEEHKPWQPNHRTGSARSEGFYRISRKDKMKYLNNSKLATELPSTSAQQGICVPAQQPTSLRAGSDFRSEQRRLLSSFSCDSDLVKFNQLKFRKKRICFSRSHIHEWGLFAMEPIAADEMVIEYVGQIIRQVIADMREQRYEEEGIGSSYLFRVDQDTIIDATKYGNLARFINHSCNPNCYAKIITVKSQKKIVIYSRQPISIHEEITYDYKFPIEDTKIPCLCGADSCRGSLN